MFWVGIAIGLLLFPLACAALLIAYVLFGDWEFWH